MGSQAGGGVGVLKSEWIEIYFGGSVAGLADGLYVGGEKKKRFQGN